jgi:hypothetical protein
MSGMAITAAIAAALVAVTLLVFAGGGGGKSATTTAPAPNTSAACATSSGTNCVQAAKDLVRGLNAQDAAGSSAAGTQPAPANPSYP